MTWEELHFDSTTVDLHAHPTIKSFILYGNLRAKKRGLLSRIFDKGFWPFSGRVTFPKMEEGGMDVLLSTAYTLEQGWIDDISLIRWLFRLFPGIRRKVVDPTYFDATNAMMDEMENQVKKYNASIEGQEERRRARMTLSPAELEEGIASGDMCIVHAVEGGHCLQGKVGARRLQDSTASPQEIEEEIMENLESLHARGAAYLTLAHFYPNHLAYPVFPYPEYAMSHMKWREALGKWDMNMGLSVLGEKVVERMLELGMLIDVCHCTPNARKQIYDIVDHHKKKSCVVGTHMGCFGINRDPYNLADWEIEWIANNGGVIGVIFMNYWISPVDSGLGLKHIETTMDRMIDVGGENVVGIGTDFDGFIDPPDEIVDMSELPRFTKYMKALGYSDETMTKILGGNALRVLREGWKNDTRITGSSMLIAPSGSSPYHNYEY